MAVPPAAEILCPEELLAEVPSMSGPAESPGLVMQGQQLAQALRRAHVAPDRLEDERFQLGPPLLN